MQELLAKEQQEEQVLRDITGVQVYINKIAHRPITPIMQADKDMFVLCSAWKMLPS